MTMVVAGKAFVILRSPRSGCLEGRTALAAWIHADGDAL